jgi:hypothetical protein
MMETLQGSKIIEGWPEESREAAQLVIDKYGEPHESTESFLIWNQVGPWKRIIASKAFYKHDFPVPHFDSVESVLDYGVPPQYFTPLAEFDGSVMVDRTAGEVSARCHDEEANSLALNLAHDIVTGTRTVEEARQYYAKEFLDYRRRQPTPYMDELRFEAGRDTADPDERVLTDDAIERAVEEGKAAEQPAA